MVVNFASTTPIVVLILSTLLMVGARPVHKTIVRVGVTRPALLVTVLILSSVTLSFSVLLKRSVGERQRVILLSVVLLVIRKICFAIGTELQAVLKFVAVLESVMLMVLRPVRLLA